MIVLMAFSLASCGSKKEVATKNGKALSYSMDDILSKQMYGFYVMNRDGTFTPVNSSASGFTSEATSYDSSRFVWWCDLNTKNKKIDYDAITPRVTKKTPLVAIYDSTSSMPTDYVIERYKSLGYTIGANFILGDDNKSIYMSTQSPCPNSDAYNLVNGKGYDEKLEVSKLNGKRDLPYSNVDTDINALIGLQKNKYYNLEFYMGTRARTATIKADTKILKSKEVITLENPLKKTDNQYFIVNLPDNMKYGYYYINDAGLFKY